MSHRFLAKLETARAELSHARPGASAEEVLEACLDLLLAQRAKRKALVSNPRPPRATPARLAAGMEGPQTAAPVAPSNDVAPVPPPPPARRPFPAAVRREAWTRAGGR